MKKFSHSAFVLILVAAGISAVTFLSFEGWDYYITPFEMRPFTSHYQYMKPSGSYSHGLGIFGALMIIVGVTLYSGRKRLSILKDLGKLPRWLETHIFLCLLGPILIVYHTTFKSGGIAAITLWTMLSVVASGIIGRFLYIQIPRNLKGKELSMAEISKEILNIGSALQASEMGKKIIQLVDGAFSEIQEPRSIPEISSALIQLHRTRRVVKKKVRFLIAESGISIESAHEIRSRASARAALLQKALLLKQVERTFFYWHAIHLPFTIIMFITLAVHVTVVILLGYRWIL